MPVLVLDFAQLPSYQERRFVPFKINLTDAETVAHLTRKLLERRLHTAADLEAWLLDRSELDASVDQAGTILYIQMTCQTDDQEKAEAYKRFVETVPAALKPLADQLNKKYLEEQKRFPLDERRYGMYTRAVKSEIDIFREANVPLQTELSLLAQEYQTICAGMTVFFEGRERTLPEMNKYLLEPDRTLREAAWRAVAQRRLQERGKLDIVFDRMLVLRHQVAVNAGFGNYEDYQFKALQRFDYTPQDCQNYHRTVEQLVVPVLKKISQKRRQIMGLSSLRPWDLSVDPYGRKPLLPFEGGEALIKGCSQIFDRLHPALARQFSEIAARGLLDVESRKGKAPGGYQSTLDEARLPFIFMNAVGVEDDVNTLLHEAGHAFHALACRQQPLLFDRHGPMEFNEVASMAMELLAGEHLDVFYNASDKQRARKNHLEDVIQVLVWVAVIDGFQEWIYQHPQASAQERSLAWLDIRERFGASCVDWSGLEDAHAALWQRQLHIFEVPFYYIEYGIAQIGALQLWVQSRKNASEALENYLRALKLGGSRPLSELYQTAGIRFDFSPETLKPLVAEISALLELGD